MTIKLLFGFAILFAAAPQEVEIATTLSFTEGPTVDRDGNVYFTDIMTQRIMKLSAAGVQSFTLRGVQYSTFRQAPSTLVVLRLLTSTYQIPEFPSN